jgi:biotin synthase
MMLLDTNVLIYAADGQAKLHQWARLTIAEGVSGDGAAVNAISVAEVCVGDLDPESVADRIRSWGVAELGRGLRRFLPATILLLANTSLVNASEAEALRAAGFNGVYKTIRMREGVDTPFTAATRLESIKIARTAGLDIYALLEPIGPEHTAAELAEAVVRLRDEIKPVLVGAMARVPVAGSPLEHFGQIGDEYLADLTAILVVALLSALPQCPLVCSHPASPLLAQAGANAYVCEVGSVPRDTKYMSAEWHRFTPTDAKRLLTAQGYHFV